MVVERAEVEMEVVREAGAMAVEEKAEVVVAGRVAAAVVGMTAGEMGVEGKAEVERARVNGVAKVRRWK